MPERTSRSDEGAFLADPDAVERADNRVRETVLLIGALGEILGCQLLETVGRAGRRATALLSFGRRVDRGTLVDHGRGNHSDLLEPACAVGLDGRVKRSRGDPFVLGHQVVGAFVKESDSPDDRCSGHEMVAAIEGLEEQV